jgi:hypothetical protein
VFSLLLYEAFVVVLAPFVVCCASVSSSCVCFWFLRLNPSYRLLFVVFVTSFAPYYLTLFMHLSTCPRISVFLVIFRCIVTLLSQAFGLHYSASDYLKILAFHKETIAILTCCPHDGNLAVAVALRSMSVSTLHSCRIYHLYLIFLKFNIEFRCSV